MRNIYLVPTLALLFSGQLQAGAVEALQQGYRAAGAGNFSATAGERLWSRSFTAASDGSQRRCGSCHGDDLAAPGRHHRTGKSIEPLAPSVNARRLRDQKQIEKWLKRNCQWTLGRECTAQEKGDLLAFLQTR